ncbi:glycoside hydrolase family 88 protein [Levilactobacillus fujinensis]|uniref:Glycoside hydrolase family 88 protein n=1 Tax=Levilactobacillus fujinensis TaxID=2486024 RepID=A0ABW1TKC6_9LACO|nr:glycoside hydrolase family 88 protein [Levilactobacillus fujinensis]
MIETKVDWATAALKQVEQKMSWVADKTQDRIPYTTDSAGNYDDHSSLSEQTAEYYSLSWWTNGFYPGMLWQMYRQTGAEKYRTYAEKIERKLALTLTSFEGLHHDVGFMFLLSSGANYRLTHNKQAYTRVIHAATILAGRFNLAGRFIRAWNDEGTVDRRGWTIIDSMMNIRLLYWATDLTHDPRFAQIAQAHAITVQNHFIREDGSVKHICEFNPETGAYVKSFGGQGLQRGSAWTRGQAWAIYGFTMSYEQTHDAEFLQTASKVADYFMQQMKEWTHVPIDFNQPKAVAYEDSSAAAIAASAFLELASQQENQKLAQIYQRFGEQLLEHLLADRCDFSMDCDNIVTRASASYHEEQHDYAIIYADFFLIEALQKLTHKSLPVWGQVKNPEGI